MRLDEALSVLDAKYVPEIKEAIRGSILEILEGIDREDTTEGGWWETSTGAEFGARKLAELLEALGLPRETT